MDPGPEQDDRENGEHTDADGNQPAPAARVPAARVDLRGDLGLEAREARAVARAVALDRLPKLGEPLALALDHRIDHLGHGRLEVGQLQCRVAHGHLKVGNVLVAEPAPDLALGRDGDRLVAAAADQVEERRRELVRAGRLLLAQQRRHERRLGVGRRLLLVLAVVARLSLPPVDEPDERHQRCRGAEPQEQQVEERSADVALGVVDSVAVVLVRALRADLLGDDLLEPVALPNLCAGGRREHAPREDDAELDELVRRDLPRPPGTPSWGCA